MTNYTLGSWITSDSLPIVEVMAESGFDWLCIDLEHTMIDYEGVQKLIIAIQSKNLKAYVRVGSNDELIIKRVLDSGASGIIVPLIKTKKDAIEAVNNTFYPPVGARGVNSLSRAQKYGFGFQDYLKKVNKDTHLILQIEHIDAIQNLEEILKIKKVTGMIIGPYDLSASMGKAGKFQDKEVKKAINKYETLMNKSKKLFGYHVTDPKQDQVIAKIKKGYNFIALSWDTYLLGQTCRDKLEKIRKKT